MAPPREMAKEEAIVKKDDSAKEDVKSVSITLIEKDGVS
jgi:hypothetical protein